MCGVGTSEVVLTAAPTVPTPLTQREQVRHIHWRNAPTSFLGNYMSNSSDTGDNTNLSSTPSMGPSIKLSTGTSYFVLNESNKEISTGKPQERNNIRDTRGNPDNTIHTEGSKKK